ncbi:hypothetical protein ZHAS_00008573 [Anopheles sinensis]|uniref:Uncharacterized protein n=1 Tax=Anopheles sinensis TaxID=74873 RepID=A0A084VT20_ANOSI|nr:hypothetical protein ZHAS_00008573 [Anopheles sinensis]
MTNDDSCSASDAGNNVVAMASNGSGDGDVVSKHQQQRKHAKQQQQRQGLRDESLRRLVDGQVRRKQRPGSAAILEGVIGPKAHLKLVSQELEWERKFRDDQLSRILKALIAFETRLKNEQTRIKQQLYEKDDVINRQNCTINRMKRKLAADETAGSDDGEEETTIDEVAQYCPKCRKNYYRLECRTNGTQTFEYCREDGAESVNTENLSLNSVEYASSSEEQESSLYVRANSFKDARRSRKYTSKRSYQGYQQRGTASRASSFKSNASGPTTGRTLAKLTERNEGRDAIRLQRGGSAAADDDDAESGHEAYVNIEPNANVPKIVIYENYESDKENKRLDQNQRPRECNNYDNVEPYSNRIDTLHGIHAGRFGKQHADGRNDYHLASPSKRGSVDGSEEQMELDDGTVFYEANTTGGGGNNQAKYTEGMEMKQTIETNDDWYASASDMEDSDTALGKPYSNAAVNPVLECVNQILLQQSMDGFGDSNKDTTTNGDGNAVGEEDELYIKAQELPSQQQQQQPAPVKAPSTTVRSKRVHFSTQNSMVQVPRITTGPTILGAGSGNRKDDKLSPTYEIQSIYSNEYEPIGSEQNSYSNYYVDMESKLGSEDREREMALAEKRKTPPALPPKPANLLKLQQLSKTNQRGGGGGGGVLIGGSALKGTARHAPSSSAQSDIAESEPDYCSISEIQDSVKCVQIVAEIHKDACEDDYSIVDEEETGPVGEKREQNGTEATAEEKPVETGSRKSSSELEESFADVPKLPNVAEIVVPPKKDSLNKFISQDNYITKSSSSGSSTTSGKVMLSSGSMPNGGGPVQTTPSKKDGEFREQLSEIIAEINKQSPAIRTASKKQIPVKDLGSPFRGVSQIPGVSFQSKLKPVDKLSFLSKGSSGSIPSLNHHHHTPKLTTATTTTSAIGRPAIKPTLLKSSLSTKALSSTNLSLGNNLNQFGSPVKSVSYIPNLKSLNATGPRENGGSSSVSCSPVKSSSPVKKAPERVTGTPVVSAGGTPTSSTPVIIAEDSKLPIQAEFDWYNLDAEYGKSNQPDVIVEADPCTPGSEPPTGAGTVVEEQDATSNRSNSGQVNGTQGSVKGAQNKSLPTPNGGHSKAIGSAGENGTTECHEDEELENVEYNLDEEYKSIGPIVPPPDIIQKGAPPPPLTPPKNGKIPYNSLSFKELMQLNETPKIGPEKGKAKTAAPTTGGGTGGTENGGPTTGNYEHFLDDSGLCSKPIILPRKKRVYYSGPFV